MITTTKQQREEMGSIEKLLNTRITVCDCCGQASCWQGIFMCDLYKTAGTRKVKVIELVKADMEHPSYWKTDKELADGR